MDEIINLVYLKLLKQELLGGRLRLGGVLVTRRVSDEYLGLVDWMVPTQVESHISIYPLGKYVNLATATLILRICLF